jgi:hypothetical protein
MQMYTIHLQHQTFLHTDTYEKLTFRDFYLKTSTEYLIIDCKINKFGCEDYWKKRLTVYGTCIEFDVLEAARVKDFI